MPDVVGRTIEEARELILNAHMTVGDVKEVWSEKAPVGEVIDCSHEFGDELPPNTSIDLSVSKGRQPIEIKSYVGKPRDDAVAALEKAGFKVSVTEDYSRDVPKGTVMGQAPSEGTGYKGDTLELVISLGPKMVEVPNVRNMSKADAIKELKKAGFEVEERDVNPIGIPLGRAYSTEPAAGELAAQGSTVVLNIV